MGRTAMLEQPKAALTQVKPRHRMMMYRILAGEKQCDIALEMNISETRLSIIVNSPLFKMELAKLETELAKRALEKKSDITAKIAGLEPEALDTIAELMRRNLSAPGLKRLCAKDILELGQKERQTRNGNSGSSAADLIIGAFELAKQRYEERKREAQGKTLPAASVADAIAEDF